MCGKRFKQKGNVKPHIENVHEKKRRWICKFYDAGGPRCGKDFSTIGNMKVSPISPLLHLRFGRKLKTLVWHVELY